MPEPEVKVRELDPPDARGRALYLVRIEPRHDYLVEAEDEDGAIRQARDLHGAKTP